MEETGKAVDTSLIIWTSDDNESNCAGAGRHRIRNQRRLGDASLISSPHRSVSNAEISDESEFRVFQYFVVMEKLSFVCYDPRFAMFVSPDVRKIALDYFVILVKREKVQDPGAKYLESQRTTIQEVDEIVNKLTFYL